MSWLNASRLGVSCWFDFLTWLLDLTLWLDFLTWLLDFLKIIPNISPLKERYSIGLKWRNIEYFRFILQGRSRDPRRRATVVSYNPQVNRSMDYDGTMSEVDAPTFHRGGFVRSSLPATRSPPAVLDKPLGNWDNIRLNFLWRIFSPVFTAISAMCQLEKIIQFSNELSWLLGSM